MMQAAQSRPSHNPAGPARVRLRQPASRRFLRQAKVSPVLMVVVDVLVHEALQVPLVEHNDMVEQIAASYNPANNRIQSVWGTTSAAFSYDASGNTLWDGISHYWYDAEGRLCAVARLKPEALRPHCGEATPHIQVQVRCRKQRCWRRRAGPPGTFHRGRIWCDRQR